MSDTTQDSITISSLELQDLNTCSLDPWYGAVPPSWTATGPGTNATPITVTAGAVGPVNLGNWDFGNITFQDSMPRSGTISLRGEDADIEINGESLLGMIRGIQDRLNILSPDPDMEQEWDQLREIRQQYEAKLAECREKSRMWKQLKDLPPPEQL